MSASKDQQQNENIKRPKAGAFFRRYDLLIFLGSLLVFISVVAENALYPSPKKNADCFFTSENVGGLTRARRSGASPRGASSYNNLNPTKGNASAIDINTAPEELLISLPGIGPVIAGRIIEHRRANGPFRAREELISVPGIGQVTLSRIYDLIRLTPAESEKEDEGNDNVERRQDSE